MTEQDFDNMTEDERAEWTAAQSVRHGYGNAHVPTQQELRRWVAEAPAP
jgi:hypothetical protein